MSVFKDFGAAVEDQRIVLTGRFAESVAVKAASYVLLSDRLQDQDSVKFYSLSSARVIDEWRATTAHCLAEKLYDTMSLDNSVIVASYNSHSDLLPTVSEGFIKAMNLRSANTRSYERLTAIERYLESEKQRPVYAFHDRTNRSTVILCAGVRADSFRRVLSLTPVLFPAPFVDKPFSDKEKKFLNDLAKSDADECNRYVCEFLTSSGNSIKRLTEQLRGFAAESYRRRLEEIEEDIQRLGERIQNYQQCLSDSYRALEERQLRFNALNEKILSEDTEDNELIDFIAASKSIILHDVNGSTLAVELRATLDNYDLDQYETYRKNPRSILHCTNYHQLTTEQGVKLMDAIFADQKLRVKMHACFELDFERGYYTVERSYTYRTADCVDNPHLTYYTCLGNNERDLYDALRSHDHIGALMTCIAVCANLNLSETQNVQHFIDDLLHHTGKPLILPDGTDCTVAQAIQYLEDGTMPSE